jgi:ubiquinone/menaquinone biosynthesis C-methylase UbiE
MAKTYDYMLRDAEQKCLKDWRNGLLQDLAGDVLEIGSGTGANLAHYPSTIHRLVLTEPNRMMRYKLGLKIAEYPQLPIQVADCAAEHLFYPDNSFDAVVCTLLLCSVKYPQRALYEIHRVLRPSGKLIFIEHVAAFNRPERLKWQKRFEPLWKTVQCGCHLTRDTENDILNAGFEFQTITRESIRGVPAIARPGIRGIAIKR